MITLLLANAQTAIAAPAVSNEWIIWLCAGVTLFLAFGIRLIKKAIRYNKKHHIIEWDEGKEITIEWNEADERLHTGR